MSLVNKGFDGTVTEADFAMMMFIGGRPGVQSSAAWKVTQGAGRQVSCASNAGWVFAPGVVSKDSTSPLTANLSTPINGQWFCIAARVNWVANTVTLVAIAHDTTSAVAPTAAPTTYPTLNQDPGTLYDLPLAWAWCRSTDTTVTIFDLRTWPGIPVDLADLATRGGPEGYRLTVAEGGAEFVRQGGKWVQVTPAIFADTAARDAAYAKAGGAFRVATARAQIASELWPRRYDTASSSWMPVLDRGGSLPVKPASVAGTGVTIASDGSVAAAGASSITIDGISPDAAGKYRIVIDVEASAAAAIEMALRAGGADITTGYDRSRTGGTGSSTPTSLQAGNSGTWVIVAAAVAGRHVIVLDPVTQMGQAAKTVAQYTSTAVDNPMTAAAAQATGVLQQRASTACDGIKLTVASGTLTGTIRILELV